MKFFCSQAWPQCCPEDGEIWPPEGSIKYNTILQLDPYTVRREGKWAEVPHVKAFFVLGEQADLCKSYKLGPILLASINDQEEQILSNSLPEVPSMVVAPSKPSCPPYPGTPETKSLRDEKRCAHYVH